MIRATLLAPIALPALLLSQPGAAQDASFGRKVLLCAATAAPSWSGIPYCVPVMQQLFTQFAKGEGWPPCAQGNASPVGYQPFDASPAGAVPIAANQVNASGRGGDATTAYSASASGSECGAPTPLQTGSSEGCNGAYVGGTATRPKSFGRDSIDGRTKCRAEAAPANAAPYYVDTTTAKGVSRFTFSHQGYGG